MAKTDDIVEIASKASNFKIFTVALAIAGMDQALQGAEPFTVFAPTDDAFAKIPPRRLDDLLKPENKETLQSMLSSHIVSGKLKTPELKRLDGARAISGEELLFETRSGLWINEAQIVLPDLDASNGVLHGIDCVLTSRPQVVAD